MDERVVDLVRRLRGLGFLSWAGDAPDVEVAVDLDARHEAAWGEHLDPDDPLTPVVVLASDHDRVWWGDLEADALPGNGVYEEVVPQWASLVGAAVTAVSEQWPDDGGGPSIRVTVDEAEVELAARSLEDWIDLAVLAQLDDALASVGAGGRPRLRVVEPFDQTAVVVAVPDDDRVALASVLGRDLLVASTF